MVEDIFLGPASLESSTVSSPSGFGAGLGLPSDNILNLGIMAYKLNTETVVNKTKVSHVRKH